MKKYLPVLLLVSIVSASLFMIVESGDYYSTFYPNKYQGYWAAFLVEAFLAIAAMLYVSNKKFLNFCIKIVMIPLFFVVVGGASLKVASPLLTQLAKVETQNELVDLLKQQNQQANIHLAKLDGQRVNTALAVKHQRQISSRLAMEIKNKTSAPWMIWIVILFSTFLRLSIQLANLVFAHSLGQLWRSRSKPGLQPNNRDSSITQKSAMQIKQDRVLEYLKRNGGKATRNQVITSRVCKNGVKEYDRILNSLMRVGKISVNSEKVSKRDWEYCIHQ